MIYGSSVPSWRPVQRPVAKDDPAKFISQYRAPIQSPRPPVAPKPKVIVYEYSTPQQDFIDYSTVKQHQQEPAPRERLRERSKRNSRGYKVLADVTPNLRATSKGGQMFIKQRHRMNNYTRESQKAAQEGDPEIKNIARKKLQALGVTDTWATPWNMATASSSAVKYLPANTIERSIPSSAGNVKRIPMGLMPRPPNHWRAKVEEDYPTYPGVNPPPMKISPPIKVRRVRNHDGYTTEVEEPRRNYTPQPPRPGSAPAVENENGDSGFGNDQHRNIYKDVNNDAVEKQAPKVSIPAATLHFNARDNYVTPHRQQGIRQGRGIFTTTPYVMLDFNARPKGWNRQANYYC